MTLTKLTCQCDCLACCAARCARYSTKKQNAKQSSWNHPCCSPNTAWRLPHPANLKPGQAPCPPTKPILNCINLVAPPCQNLSCFFPACTHRRIMLSAEEIFECEPQTTSRWGQGICIESSKLADACARECLVMMHDQKCSSIKCAPDTNQPSQSKVM